MTASQRTQILDALAHAERFLGFARAHLSQIPAVLSGSGNSVGFAADADLLLVRVAGMRAEVLAEQVSPEPAAPGEPESGSAAT